MLQSYRSTVFEATCFTSTRLAFGRKMLLFVDFGTQLPAPPREVRTCASAFATDLEWFDKVVRNIIGHEHKSAEIRYNNRVVERAYQPASLVCILLQERNRNVASKLDRQ